jgi:hypothetical protein
VENHSLEVICPECGVILSIENIGRSTANIACPRCGAAFAIEFDGDDLQPKQEEPSTEPTEDSSPSSFDKENVTEDPGEEVTGDDGSDDQQIADAAEMIFGLPTPLLITLLSTIILLLVAIIFYLIQSNRANLPEAGDKPTRIEESVEPPQTPILPDETAEELEPSSADGFPEEDVYPETDAPEQESLSDNYFPDFQFPDESVGLSREDLSPDEGSSPEEPAEADEHSDEQPSLTESSEPQTTKSQTAESQPEPNEENSEGESEAFDVDTYSDRDITATFARISEIIPESIDLSKRLDLTFRKIRLSEAGLSDFIRVFYQLTGIPVQLNWTAFPTPVFFWEKRTNYEGNDVTAREFLNEFSTSFALEVERLDDRVCLSLPSSFTDETEEVSFDCSDLLTPPPEAAEAPAESGEIPESVFPEVLTLPLLESALHDLVLDVAFRDEEESPTPELKVEGTTLRLTADPRTLENAAIFLDCLRALRFLPQKRITAAEVLIPETLCWENKLGVPASLCLLRPLPLSEILLLLGKEYQLRFYIDYAALPGLGADLETPVSLIASEKPIDQILTALLDPLNLDYVILTEDLIAVTSRDQGEKVDAEIHFYAAPNEEVSLDEALALADRIREKVAPETWKPDSKERGKIWIDPVSHSFYIRQTIRNQQKIRRLIQPGLVGKEISL